MKQEAVEPSIWHNHNAKPLSVTGDTSPPPLPAKCSLPADQIRYSCAPPISLPPNGVKTTLDKLLVDIASASRLDSQTRRSRRKNLSSTSWLSSITLHVGVFLLLALILVPANFGGMSTLSIFLTSEQQSENLVVFKPGISEPLQTPDDTPQFIPTSFPGQLDDQRAGRCYVPLGICQWWIG